jgi:hypothetical protein
MSLYSHEEICKGCELAIFHTCCGKFCKCSGNHAWSADHCEGTCSFKLPLSYDGKQPVEE